ncbi:hypothetical protein HN587_00140 [Candidatus Woesearchaeota archaeon]|jgi:hypothetical protein|nr:hypothetical protein [Candidatus Woesearchaeota archaeon]
MNEINQKQLDKVSEMKQMQGLIRSKHPEWGQEKVRFVALRMLCELPRR